MGTAAFIGNSALNGGRVHLQFQNNVSTSGNSKFIGNSAGKFGGRVHLWVGNIGTIVGTPHSSTIQPPGMVEESIHGRRLPFDNFSAISVIFI